MVKQRHIEVLILMLVVSMLIMSHYAERVRIAHGHMEASTQVCM